jgi:hypothetical protein
MSGCAIAADTKLETPEGPLTVKTVLKSPTAVMTRTDEGAVRFAMSSGATVVGESLPVLRIVLDNGRSLRVGADQVLFAAGMREVAAGELRSGDRLESVFSFPKGYAYKTDAGEERVSDGAVGVTAVEPGGEAEVHRLTVARTGRFVFSAGVLGKAA